MNKAFLFSDLHCNNSQLSNMYDFVIQKENNIKLLIFAGDVVNMGEPVWFSEKFISKIIDSDIDFVWVPGNNDFGRSYHKIQAKIKSIEGKIIELYGRNFTGVGGSPASWAGQYAGESMVDKKKIKDSIFISHYPPPGILSLQQKDIKFPSSTKKFSDSPLIHICGHLHYRYGTAFLGQTKVIQLASLETGNYAILDLDTLSVEFKKFKQSYVPNLEQ